MWVLRAIREAILSRTRNRLTGQNCYKGFGKCCYTNSGSTGADGLRGTVASERTSGTGSGREDVGGSRCKTEGVHAGLFPVEAGPTKQFACKGFIANALKKGNRSTLPLP
jgi:hypothetical protein